jgi:hypothetical protein
MTLYEIFLACPLIQQPSFTYSKEYTAIIALCHKKISLETSFIMQKDTTVTSNDQKTKKLPHVFPAKNPRPKPKSIPRLVES